MAAPIWRKVTCVMETIENTGEGVVIACSGTVVDCGETEVVPAEAVVEETTFEQRAALAYLAHTVAMDGVGRLSYWQAVSMCREAELGYHQIDALVDLVLKVAPLPQTPF